MSSKESLIRGLYKAAVGESVQSATGKRLVDATNTLMDRVVSEETVSKAATIIPEIAVEKREYRKILYGEQRMKSVLMKPHGIIKEVRLVETNSLAPTGNSSIIPVLGMIIGNGENGVVKGYTVIAFGQNTW